MTDVEADLARLFPDLSPDRYSITSPSDRNYNCVAWAADDDEHWWWPAYGSYWPNEVERECTLDRFREAFELQGYEPCDEAHFEAGYTKIAVYVNTAGVPTHAARQTTDGRWTSKLGRFVDIQHEAPGDLGGFAGSAYGEVGLIMKRRTS